MKKIASLVFLSLSMATAHTSAALEAGKEVIVKLTVQKVQRQKDGSEILGKADAAPGDTVQYQVLYANEGKAAVHQLLATLPIPAPNMEYLPGSSSPPNPEASIDGKTFGAMPLKREVVASDGSRRWESVPVADYRFLRWQVGELPAGKSFTVSARMKLTKDPEPGQAGKP
ncbi:MAG: hypothetical protein ACRYF5_18480 [Janthinobacterium lividum]